MATLIDFLNTGQIGDLRCGLSRQEVRCLLGEPEAVSTRRNPQICKYGSVELTFHGSSPAEEPRLAAIVVHFHSDIFKLPESLALAGWLPTGETTFDEFRELLDDAGIPVAGGVAAGLSQHLVLGSGVRVTFDQGRLDSVGYTMRQEPELRQITVAVPRGVLSMIQTEAAASGLSVSKLCSRWIEERAAALPSVVEAGPRRGSAADG